MRSLRRRAAPSSQSPSTVTSRYCQPPQPGHMLWQHRLPAASAAALPAAPHWPVPSPASTAVTVTAPFRAALDATLPSKGFVVGFAVGFDGTGGFGAEVRPAEATRRNPLSTPCALPRLCERLRCTPPLPTGARRPWSLSSAAAAAAATTTCEGSREVPRSGTASVLHLKGPTASRLIRRRGQVGETMLGRVLKGAT